MARLTLATHKAVCCFIDRSTRKITPHKTKSTVSVTALPIAFMLAVMAPSATADTSVRITGIEDDLKENVELIVGTPPEDPESRQFRRYVAELPDLAVEALSALGYYGASASVRQSTDGEDTLLSVVVNPNEPVRIESIDIAINGAGLVDSAYISVLNDVLIKSGDIFVSSDYEAAKASLLDRAQDLGYFDFTFTQSEVRVSRKRLSANIKLAANTGVRYTFGPIIFEQETFQKTFLDRWVPFSEGDPYESGLTGELTQNLQNSGYFKSVRVQPQQDRRYGKTIPVKVDLALRDTNQVAVGVGFATDIGLRSKLTWSKPFLNRRGHSADFELGVAKDVQNASVSYRVPRRNQPLYNYWGLEYGVKNDTVDDTESFLSTFNLQRVSRTKSNWSESFFVRWERERSRKGDDAAEMTDLVLPGISYSRSRSKGSPFPVWGQATSFQILGGSTRLFSSIDIFKVAGTFRYLRALSNRNTIIAGIQYGAIQSNDFDRVPISQRFFAGGDRSVRGFGYRNLSPLNSEDEAVGGRYLEVLSLEYNYRFRDQWSGAMFVDAGRAFNTFSAPYNVGAGFGIRWQSPVGPFRVDIATPISDNDQGTVRLHLSLGQDI